MTQAIKDRFFEELDTFFSRQDEAKTLRVAAEVKADEAVQAEQAAQAADEEAGLAEQSANDQYEFTRGYYEALKTGNAPPDEDDPSPASPVE